MASRILWICSYTILAAGLGTAAYLQTRIRTNRAPGEPMHPISRQMVAETAEKTRARAPMFVLKDQVGKEFSLATALKNGPALVVFTICECPCSIDAQPLFNALQAHYGKKITFIGMCRNTQLDASNYVVNMSVRYPLLIDPDKSIINAFGAKNSVYTALINPDGTIEKMWPGYDVELTGEINATLAKASGLPLAKLDLDHVPKKPTSGCTL